MDTYAQKQDRIGLSDGLFVTCNLLHDVTKVEIFSIMIRINSIYYFSKPLKRTMLQIKVSKFLKGNISTGHRLKRPCRMK